MSEEMAPDGNGLSQAERDAWANMDPAVIDDAEYGKQVESKQMGQMGGQVEFSAGEEGGPDVMAGGNESVSTEGGGELVEGGNIIGEADEAEERRVAELRKLIKAYGGAEALVAAINAMKPEEEDALEQGRDWAEGGYQEYMQNRDSSGGGESDSGSSDSDLKSVVAEGISDGTMRDADAASDGTGAGKMTGADEAVVGSGASAVAAGGSEAAEMGKTENHGLLTGFYTRSETEGEIRRLMKEGKVTQEKGEEVIGGLGDGQYTRGEILNRLGLWGGKEGDPKSLPGENVGAGPDGVVAVEKDAADIVGVGAFGRDETERKIVDLVALKFVDEKKARGVIGQLREGGLYTRKYILEALGLQKEEESRVGDSEAVGQAQAAGGSEAAEMGKTENHGLLARFYTRSETEGEIRRLVVDGKVTQEKGEEVIGQLGDGQYTRKDILDRLGLWGEKKRDLKSLVSEVVGKEFFNEKEIKKAVRAAQRRNGIFGKRPESENETVKGGVIREMLRRKMKDIRERTNKGKELTPKEKELIGWSRDNWSWLKEYVLTDKEKATETARSKAVAGEENERWSQQAA